MLGSMSKALLAAALAVSCLAAARPQPPPKKPLQHLTEEAVHAALSPLPGVSFRRHRPASQRTTKRQAKDRFQTTSSYAQLRPYSGTQSGQLSATRRLGAAQCRHGGGTGSGSGGYENITASNAYGTQYGLAVTFGHQTLLLDLDTGSSDTWAFHSGTNCTDPLGGAVPSRYCRFGPRYRGNFTGGAVAGEHLYVEYGDGETVEGPLGRMDVTVGGVRVRNQTVGLADETWWQGNNRSSGVLGLAYPGLTNAFYGVAGGREDPDFAIEYSPVFSTMVDQGLVDAFFSVAINRPGGSDVAGVIGFGGVPEDVDGVDYDSAGQADIIVVGHLPDLSPGEANNIFLGGNPC